MLYEIPSIEYVEATTIDQAVSILQAQGDKAAVIAGATDLLGLLKDKIKGPELELHKLW